MTSPQRDEQAERELQQRLADLVKARSERKHPDEPVIYHAQHPRQWRAT